MNAYLHDTEYYVAPPNPAIHRLARLQMKLAIIVMADYVA